MIKEEPNQNSQPQYEKYIKCHVYRIHPGTFGNHCCDDQWINNGDGGCGGGDQSGHGCKGPGDPGMPGHGWTFTYGEIVNDQAPCMDFEDVCTPFDYAFDCMNGNGSYDHGLLKGNPPCNKGSDKGPLSLCYS